eukprot:jgi/Botrbrau1/20429/Bobra.0627s0001.1
MRSRIIVAILLGTVFLCQIRHSVCFTYKRGIIISGELCSQCQCSNKCPKRMSGLGLLLYSLIIPPPAQPLKEVKPLRKGIGQLAIPPFRA